MCIMCSEWLSHSKPVVLRMPATTPAATAVAGENDKLAVGPIAIPLTWVAFWMRTLLKLPFQPAEVVKTAIAVLNSARMVFTMHRSCLWPPQLLARWLLDLMLRAAKQ